MTRFLGLSFALTSLFGTVACERTATTVPDEPVAEDWEPSEKKAEAPERPEDVEQAPFLSARE